MSDLYLLDTGPLGLVTNPKVSVEASRCRGWLRWVLASGDHVMIPEVVDYELRRELVRAYRSKGLARLDALTEQLGTLPVELRTWRKAAEIWAQARNEGRTTASDASLDGDVILASVAQIASEDGRKVIVVTANVGHLARYCHAVDWKVLADLHEQCSGDINA